MGHQIKSRPNTQPVQGTSIRNRKPVMGLDIREELGWGALWSYHLGSALAHPMGKDAYQLPLLWVPHSPFANKLPGGPE